MVSKKGRRTWWAHDDGQSRGLGAARVARVRSRRPGEERTVTRGCLSKRLHVMISLAKVSLFLFHFFFLKFKWGMMIRSQGYSVPWNQARKLFRETMFLPEYKGLWQSPIQGADSRVLSLSSLGSALRSQTDTIKEKGSLRSWNHWHKSSKLSSQRGPQTLAQRPGNILSGKSYLTHSCYKWGCLLPTPADQGLWGGRGRQLWEMRTMIKSKAPTDRRDLDL